MSLSTTVIGSMPKPANFHIPCWVRDGVLVGNFVAEYNKILSVQDSEDFENQLTRVTQDIIYLQEKVGLSVITDGELRREQYIYGFCRNLGGFDFVNTKKKLCRNGAWECLLPRIVSKICHKGEAGFMAKEWKWSQKMSNLPVKVTIPGPMTITDTFCNDFYEDERTLFQDLVNCINIELKLLAKAGCKQVQVDEPLLMRNPDKASEYGISYLSKCFSGLPDDVFKAVHACCGYPNYLDQTDYIKADKDAYLQLSKELDNANFDAISIEDAHRRNDPRLFQAFQKKKVILGVIDVAKSRVETVEEIQEHIRDVLKYIPKDRLIIAPDCGLVFLSLDLAEKKLTNMVEAAKSFS